MSAKPPRTPGSFTVDFIGIGAVRAGTTWVSECIRRHPQVSFAFEKEVFFFNRATTVLFYDQADDQDNYHRGLGWYTKQFPPKRDAGLVRGEFTPEYLYDEEAPARIHRHFPDLFFRRYTNS